MKLTKHKADFVKNRIRKYCLEMKVAPPNLLILTDKEWKEWASYQKSITGRITYRSSYRALGICNKKKKVIAIFIKKFDSMVKMDETIRHELVHYVRSYRHYTAPFNRCMEQIKHGKLIA